jgi:hypothetical protein
MMRFIEFVQAAVQNTAAMINVEKIDLISGEILQAFC